MNKVYSAGIFVLVLAFAVSISFAEMGGGMMGDQKGETDPGMMGGQQGQMMEQGGMMHGDMMNGIGSNMKHASNMMQRMSGVMHKEMTSSEMREMSAIMMDMSSHIKYMSEIMQKGSATRKEMHSINDHMKEMEKRFNMMKFK